MGRRVKRCRGARKRFAKPAPCGHDAARKGGALAGLLIFTDLDGTLLDHETYSWRAAEPALAMLRQRGAGVILASSKTAAEIAPLRDEIGFADWPAIVENGAGLLPAGAAASEVEGDAYQRLHAALDKLPADLRARFTGFGDMGAEGIARATGLPPDQAALAAARHFSEPGLFTGDEADEAAFTAALAEHGITARRGGRFLTLSFGATKADRMAEIKSDHAPDGVTIALGDAPNDAEMIAAADHGVIVANPHGTGLPPLDGEAEGRITRTRRPGPEGWNAAILALVERLDGATKTGVSGIG